MTTAAVNVYVNHQPRYNVLRTHLGSGSQVTQQIIPGWQTERRTRPASSSSPVREDGSRAPRAWSHRWGSVLSPHRTGVVVVHDWGTNYYQFHGRWLLAGNVYASSSQDALVQFANAAGNPWVNAGVHPFPSNVRAAAITKLRLKIVDQKASWGVTLGEMRSTIRGVRSIMEQILSFADTVARSVRTQRKDIMFFLYHNRWPRRSKPSRWSEKQRVRTEKWITSRWLEFRFSVLPTLMDIEQSSEALSWLLFEEQRPMRFTVKAGAKEEWTGTWESRWPQGGEQRVTYFADLRVPSLSEAMCHFSLVYEVDPTTTTTFQQLGLTNVLAVGWELTAFSWMFDYLVSVGDWLNSMVSLDGARFVEGSESRLARVRSNGAIQLHPRPYATLSGFGSATPQYEVGRFERIVLSAIPAPSLHPPVRNKLGLTQLANVLAVASQLASARR